MAKYALLLPHAPDRYTGISDEEYGKIMQDYFAWVEAKVASGAYQGGHKLKTDAGRYLSSRDGELQVHDIASTEIAELLGGIMIIEAESLDAAVEAVRDHPQFVHNQSMTILPIDPAAED